MCIYLSSMIRVVLQALHHDLIDDGIAGKKDEKKDEKNDDKKEGEEKKVNNFAEDKKLGAS